MEIVDAKCDVSQECFYPHLLCANENKEPLCLRLLLTGFWLSSVALEGWGQCSH